LKTLSIKDSSNLSQQLLQQREDHAALLTQVDDIMAELGVQGYSSVVDMNGCVTQFNENKDGNELDIRFDD